MGTLNQYNLSHALAALGGRVALAPPAPGDWGLVGRDEELERLHSHLQRHAGTAVVPVVGLGGVGKTAMALGYVARYGDHYDLIAWVQAERPELIAARYRALVRNRTGVDVAEADAVDAAKALLADTAPSLVIFDNATTPGALHPYLPSGQVTVLVTTRNETWSARRGLTFELEHLPHEVVVAWLGQELPDAPPQYLDELASRLGGLPLAVVQALAYVNARPGTTAASYLATLGTKEGQRRAFGTEPPPGYPWPVAGTWDLAITALDDEVPDAVELLRYLAFVSPEDVPLAILEGLLDDHDVADLLAALRRYGLVRTIRTHLRLHRLVQDITRWSVEADQEAAYVEAWTTHLEAVAPDPRDHTTFAWFADVAPHVLALGDHAPAIGIEPAALGALAAVANSAGISLVEQASLATGMVLLQMSLVMAEAAYGPDHPDVASTLVNLGIARHRLGDIPGAIDAYHRALAINEAAYGPDHPKVAITLTNLGAARQELGDFAGAVQAYDRALAVKETADGPDHPGVAITLTSLGAARRELGDLAGAVNAYDRAFAIFEGAYGPDHPHVAITLSSLGIARQDLGDVAGAVDAYHRALAIEEAAYGPDHPDVASTLVNLGIARQALGDLAGAVEAYHRALAINEAAYGPDHPKVAITLTNLGIARQALGDLAGAIDAYQRALAIKQAAYGPDHPQVASTLTNLGIARQALGDLAGAVEAYDRVLAIDQAAYGPDHPKVAITLTNLGIARRKLGDLGGAVHAYDRALAILERAYRPDHPQVADVLTNLGNARGALSDIAGAAEAYAQALAIYEAAYGRDHPKTTSTRQRLALALQK